MKMKHEMFSLADVCSLDGCEIQWMSQSEGLESLSMSLTWPSILQAMESSVEIMYEWLEDVMKLSEIVIFNIFLPVNMSVAFLDSSIENQKGGYIKPTESSP